VAFWLHAVHGAGDVAVVIVSPSTRRSVSVLPATTFDAGQQRSARNRSLASEARMVRATYATGGDPAFTGAVLGNPALHPPGVSARGARRSLGSGRVRTARAGQAPGWICLRALPNNRPRRPPRHPRVQARARYSRNLAMPCRTCHEVAHPKRRRSRAETNSIDRRRPTVSMSKVLPHPGPLDRSR
jgi:hypothetical protein